MTEKKRAVPADPLKRLRQVVTLVALVFALTHLIWPSLAIDGVTLGLLLIAVLPWLAPLIKTLELPGGWKVELRELQETATRVKEAGLLASAPITSKDESEFTFQVVVSHDPNLALAGLRIEIEKRLSVLAERNDIQVRAGGIGHLLRALDQVQILSREERAALADILGLLNSAVHGAEVDPRAVEWAMDFGPRLLASLDAKIAAIDN